MKLTGTSFMSSLAPMMASDHPPAGCTRGLVVERGTFDGWPVYVLRTKNPSGQAVIGVHGGAFTVEATKMNWRDYSLIARDTNASVVVPIYPLAPVGTAGTVVPQLAELVASVATRTDVQSVSLYGDSAGGTLALAATQLLVRRAQPVPNRMVLISPLLDVTLNNPACARVDDPVLDRDELRSAGAMWAGDLDPTDPLVSPLFGVLQGLPPTAVYAGSLDVLAPDVLVLRERALAEGADVTFDLRRGLIHNWATPTSREGKQVRPRIYQQLLGDWPFAET
jgi:triacylglycerol lipase